MTVLTWVFAAAILAVGWAVEHQVRRVQLTRMLNDWRDAYTRLGAVLERANETLEAERDAHRATAAELRRLEGECAALRDQHVRLLGNRDWK